MSLTRDAIQGYIDAYLELGGSPEKLKGAVDSWLEKHPVYPQKKQDRDVVLSDLESYRGVKS